MRQVLRGMVFGALAGAALGCVVALLRNGSARSVARAAKQQAPVMTSKAASIVQHGVGAAAASAPDVVRAVGQFAERSGVTEQLRATADRTRSAVLAKKPATATVRAAGDIVNAVAGRPTGGESGGRTGTARLSAD